MIKKLFTVLALCCFSAIQAQENNGTVHQRNDSDFVEIEKRIEIINYCESLKDAYKTKNIESLENIFSGETYIHTTNGIQCISKGNKHYSGHKEAKKYVHTLAEIFKRNENINIIFSDYSISKAKSDTYIVKLSHEWETKTAYRDSGIMYLMCDISDATNPKFQTLKWEDITE